MGPDQDVIPTHDANGNQTASPAYPSAGYNGIDQTTSIAPLGGSAMPFDYAGSGQAERTLAGTTTAQNGTLGVQTETTGGQTSSYVRDAGGSLVYQKTPAGDFYYYFDGQGSVIGLVDTAGNQRATYSYDPFGAHATAEGVNGTLPANPWRWNGGYLDSTGLYHFGERYYDPIMGRFLQTDPIMGGSCNAYDYACGDPINFSDTDGLRRRRAPHSGFFIESILHIDENTGNISYTTYGSASVGQVASGSWSLSRNGRELIEKSITLPDSGNAKSGSFPCEPGSYLLQGVANQGGRVATSADILVVTECPEKRKQFQNLFRSFLMQFS